MHEDKIAAAIQQLSNLRQGFRDICDLVNIQNEDERLWFNAEPFTDETYLRQGLVKLHELIRDVAERNDLKSE
jgi:hypothetical protein